MIDYYAPNIDLTLLGCGFLANYPLGAIYLLNQVWPKQPYNRICGASCGGLLGALIISGVQFDQVLSMAMGFLTQIRNFYKNPFRIVALKDLIEGWLMDALPKNAHKLCSGRVGISLTKVWPFENLFVSRFESRTELIEAVVAGCFIPIWSGKLFCPKYRGQSCVDGAYTNNAPKFPLDNNDAAPAAANNNNGRLLQLDVCAFAGECTISPPDKYGLFEFSCFKTKYFCNWNNVLRTLHAMLPFDGKIYRKYFRDGHRDMKHYILANDLVKCQNCALNQARSSTKPTSQPLADSITCLSCINLRGQVENLEVPQNLIKLIR